MHMNRFSSAVLIGLVLCTSRNDRSFAARNGDANENVASTATPEETAMQAAAYNARLAARAAADEGFFLGRRGDFRAARKKFSQAIELDPKFSPAYRLRAAAADLAQAQSLAATMPDSPPASSTPSARKNQTHHKTPRTGTSNNAKGTMR